MTGFKTLVLKTLGQLEDQEDLLENIDSSL